MGLDAFQHVPGIENISQERSNSSIVGLPNSGILKALTDEKNISASALLSQVPTTNDDIIYHNDRKTFPPKVTDINDEQVDMRATTSWKLNLDEISEIEMIETQTVNASAPFVLCGRLRKLMMVDKKDKFIINVSSMEGQFYKNYKATAHPHTNMSKAALNMMTRTCGSDYAVDHIWMNSVDTGWVTDENPQNWKSEGHVPLDEIDGAMRVLDPVSFHFT
jgi:hypothetical protein